MLRQAPKLYFVDVGLACYLLGITAAAQLARHPLRGALLENLVAIEALKAFHHRGLAPRMHFYRDGNGNEVDLLLEHGAGLHAVEIKAGATAAADYFRGLARFSALLPGRLTAGAVVYGGDSAQQRSKSRAIHGMQLRTPRGLEAHAERRLVYETEDFLPYQRRLLEERRRRWTGT